MLAPRTLALNPHTMKLARRALGLTQAALAQACGFSAAAIKEYEQGRSRPSASRAARLAAVLGLSPTELTDPAFASAGEALASARSAYAQALDADVEAAFAGAGVSPRLSAAAAAEAPLADYQALLTASFTYTEAERQERLDARARFFLSGQADLIEPELRAILATEDEAALRARAERHAARSAPPPLEL